MNPYHKIQTLTDEEMQNYLEMEYTLADESFDWNKIVDLLNDYLLMADYFPASDKDVMDYKRELERRGCLFVNRE